MEGRALQLQLGFPTPRTGPPAPRRRAARAPQLYSYVVRRDYGFAPNPFHGWCTLATCKPKIRSTAQRGDWVLGTGSKAYGLDGRIVYAMRVDEVCSFDQYWADPRFACKRPRLRGSLKQIYGDNIYHRASSGAWEQADSHHSLACGAPNQLNVMHDTSVDRVLLSQRFVYFGERALAVPEEFRSFGEERKDVCMGRQGHRVLTGAIREGFVAWLEETQQEWGVLGLPVEFRRHARAPA
jgi:Nucleotide modification associated domain 2